MIQGFLEWLPELDGKISIVVVPFIAAESSFDWTAIVSILIVGLITLAAALFSFKLSSRFEREKRVEAEKKLGAAGAMSAYFKLQHSANLVANIKKQIELSYAEAHSHGLSSSEAFMTVGPSAGMFHKPSPLEAVEYSFLLTERHLDLINDVMLVEQRALNLNCLFEQYTEQHIELQVWMDGLPGFERNLDGPIASDKFPVKYRTRLEARGAQLNRIIGGVVEFMDDDLELCVRTINSFLKAAREEYDPFFPKLGFKLEMEAGAYSKGQE